MLPSVALSSVTASWAGSDDTGVVSYRVRTRSASAGGRLGAWGPETTLPAATASRTVRYGSGATTCLQVTAVDAVGNASVPVAACVAFVADDRSLVPAARAWAVVKSRAYAFGRALSSRQRLATLTLPRATGSRLALLVRKGPGAGTVGVYVKGRRVAAVALGARRAALRQLVVLKVRTSGVPVVLRVDAPGRGVVVDGIVVLK